MTANMEYVKQRKHKKSQQRRIIRRLLNLLGKILREIRRMMREHNEQEVLTVREQSTLGIVTKVYRQQKNHFVIISVIWYRLYRCFGTANSRCRIFHIG